MKKYQRIIRKLFFNRDGIHNSRSISIDGVIKFIAIISFLFFITTQLVTNAILSPLGHELQALNSEKDLLVEDNRMLEQEVAKDNSLIIIQEYSEKQFQISANTDFDTVFVSDHTVQALK